MSVKKMVGIDRRSYCTPEAKGGRGYYVTSTLALRNGFPGKNFSMLQSGDAVSARSGPL
jgi:hypothetical protein